MRLKRTLAVVFELTVCFAVLSWCAGPRVVFAAEDVRVSPSAVVDSNPPSEGQAEPDAEAAPTEARAQAPRWRLAPGLDLARPTLFAPSASRSAFNEPKGAEPVAAESPDAGEGQVEGRSPAPAAPPRMRALVPAPPPAASSLGLQPHLAQLAYENAKKSAGLAVLFEVFFAGAGNMYAGAWDDVAITYVSTLGGIALLFSGFALLDCEPSSPYDDPPRDRSCHRSTGKVLAIGGLVTVFVGRFYGIFSAANNVSRHNGKLLERLGLSPTIHSHGGGLNVTGTF